jgi:hypothetical protein
MVVNLPEHWIAPAIHQAVSRRHADIHKLSVQDPLIDCGHRLAEIDGADPDSKDINPGMHL